MAQTINTNLMSLNAQRNLNASQSSLATSMQRLSSGMRVNSAKDDAAGLAIAERMNSQIRGMNVAIRNANDGISLAQTAEGAIGKITDMLQRMRELAVQSANDTNDPTDREALNQEYTQLGAEIDRTIKATRFNGTPILTGTQPQKFQIGAGIDPEENMVEIPALDLGSTSSAKIIEIISGSGSTIAESRDNALESMKAIDEALNEANGKRAIYGAVQNRFESIISNLQVSSENLSAARGRIMDADFAMETANLSRAQILQQAGTAMVAQANALPQQVLQLLQR